MLRTLYCAQTQQHHVLSTYTETSFGVPTPWLQEVDRYFKEEHGLNPHRIRGHKLAEFYRVVGEDGGCAWIRC
jgi:hypothetical protein